MSDRAQTDHDGRVTRIRRVIVVADPRAARRRHLVRGPSRHEIIEAASLNEVYPVAEELVPEFLALSADFLSDPVIEGVIRLADMLGTTVFFYAEDNLAPLRSALRDRVRCVPMRAQDRLDDLLARLADPYSRPAQAGAEAQEPELVLIGASTGGIAALEAVLMTFPTDCPPTLVVQHIRDGFVAGLAQRLNLRCNPRVVAAAHDLPLRRGTVYFAADADRHLTVSGRSSPRCALVASAPCQGHRPAVDPLFESAEPWGKRVSAALLTGMGSDGATGMGILRRAGAYTIAQDRATSIVWGMPGAAVAAGAAEAVLPLDHIGQSLVSGRGQIAARSLSGQAR